MKKIFAQGLVLRINGRVWIESTDGRFLGLGRIKLLEKITQFGSMAKVAAATYVTNTYTLLWAIR